MLLLFQFERLAILFLLEIFLAIPIWFFFVHLTIAKPIKGTPDSNSSVNHFNNLKEEFIV
jgi:hypothetical protein